MSYVKKKILSFIPFFLKKFFFNINENESIKKFSFENNDKFLIQKDIEEKYNHSSELLEYFVNNKGLIVHKWHHYIPIYNDYFSNFKGKKVRFLEIGVGKGGSLKMWRKYFGNDAIIFGVDINPECKKFSTDTEQIRIGSQTNKIFLKEVIEEMGGVDIILDDGSHHMEHIPETLKFLFPQLNYDGIYMIEDLHASYWKKYGGGYKNKNNFFNFIMDLTNDIHHWYHSKKIKYEMISKDCTGIFIHDSIVVLKKNRTFKPTHSKIG